MKLKHYIDSHKGATPLWVLGTMAWYHRWDNTTLWVYLALHGTYGLLWVTKSRLFPDVNWERRCSLGLGLFTWGALSLYWIAPWLIASRGIEAPPWWIALCVSLYIWGVFFHFVSDMQKHATLKIRRGLITEGLWGLSRNPNYFGELLIYLGFSLLAMHWAPLAALAGFVLGVWLPNMRRKDRSLSRYPEFAEYRRRTGLLFPLI